MGQNIKNRNLSITFVFTIIALLSMAIPASSSTCQQWNGTFGGASGIIAYLVRQPQAEGTFKTGR